MKISELQELLEMTKERHGDLEVGFKRISGKGSFTQEINKLYIEKASTYQVIDINEDIVEQDPPKLVLDHVDIAKEVLR